MNNNTFSYNNTPQSQPLQHPPNTGLQQQRPVNTHQTRTPAAFNYGDPNAASLQPQYNSQLNPPRPFPNAPVPQSVPQNFYQSNDFQQPHQPLRSASNSYVAPSSTAPQFTSHGFATPNQSQRLQHRSQTNSDFINQISQNPMAGLAMNTAQDFLTKQSEMYLPGAYGYLGSFKYYFTVNNSYVKSRMKILLMPFWHRNWRRIGSNDANDSKTHEYAPPSRDINAPDLYIPLMGFLTYILIVGYSKGTSNQFSPDVIGKDASYCLVMQLVEIGVLAACLYLLNSSISFLDLVSFSGYKYIPLVIDTIVYQLFGSISYYVVLFYSGVAVSYFTLNCMKGSVAEPTPENRAFRNSLLFGTSCLQLVLVCWISYTTAPRK